MNPDYLVSSMLALALGTSGMLRPDMRTPEERERERLEAAEREAIARAEKRAASPDVAKAEAKRLRKAEKLRRLEAKP